ncbi:bifunctional aspartate kinase/homoserine dehydrogenase I [Rhodohalobacter sp.]|uniref:bifunctional aspartate kinase/homoserine dehydrogenase I n=1 Tax=Rhodohalobacter sp. TaxID=1974210 RepID=UPI002ACE4DD0|nr:bifunctional aspartate kinase/homoserine dehydrogenase I [Rhodohalobacter sp.]MDZ7756558.1 bifunctional aspartate kinase/homoserine dehydrogenase I [Rhodohalobacter sp.]
MRILKFGGSSVGTPEALERVVAIIKEKQKEDRLIVVVSAFKGVTNQLFELASLAEEYDSRYEDILTDIEKRHIDTINQVIPVNNRSDAITDFKIMLNELENVLKGVSLVQELSNKTRDFVVGFGERFSASILSACLQNRGIDSLYTDTRQLIKTDTSFGAAKVITSTTYMNIKEFIKRNDENVIVATGFISSSEKNESTTLGRGGSDYTASLFGAATGAKMIEIWTDVDGLMTADPRKVERAFSVDYASYEEAMEMSHFGAKVIYPPTIQPVLKLGIPILIKNTFKPEHPGTLIQQKRETVNGNIRGISSIDNIALITIKGSGMIGVSGVAARIFSALAKESINIILITQSSSEHTISMAVMPNQAHAAKTSIELEFSEEIKHDIIDEIRIEKEMSAIAVVGENMRQIPGIAGQVFYALGRNGINVVAIAQGSSERNISFVVDRKNEKKAVNTIHDAFFLSGEKSINLYLVGTGLIGGMLLELLENQKEELRTKYQLDIQLKGLATSRKMLIGESSVSLSDWERELDENGREMSLSKFVEEMKAANLSNSIFIDCTASPDIQTVYEDILKQSISIVSPNKQANSSSMEFYNLLQKTADKHNCAFKFETNVGAGLPIIETIHELVRTGDKVDRIEGVLSGTLSYIFNNFDGLSSFSDVVKTAKEKGYTEPDPREDLNGNDVGRKLLILARVAGNNVEMEDIDIQNLVPEDAREVESVDEFFNKLKKHDDHYNRLQKEASSDNKKLCYIARFENGKGVVKLEKIDDSHPFYNLSGSDNIVAFYTTYYDESPLIVKGPGAGAKVTAAGVISDILRVANTKASNNAGD